MLKNNRRSWSVEEIAKLKSMAGTRSVKDIAKELGRSMGATVIMASKLKISLRTRFHFGRTYPGRMPATGYPPQVPYETND